MALIRGQRAGLGARTDRVRRLQLFAEAGLLEFHESVPPTPPSRKFDYLLEINGTRRLVNSTEVEPLLVGLYEGAAWAGGDPEVLDRLAPVVAEMVSGEETEQAR